MPGGDFYNNNGFLDPFVPFDVFGDPSKLNCDRGSQGDVFFADMSHSICKADCLENISNYSITNDKLRFDNLVLTIDRSHDIFVPKYIVSSKKIESLNIYINEQVYFDIPFDFYQKIGLIKIEKKFNKFCYNMPWEFIFSKNI